MSYPGNTGETLARIEPRAPLRDMTSGKWCTGPESGITARVWPRPGEPSQWLFRLDGRVYRTQGVFVHPVSITSTPEPEPAPGTGCVRISLPHAVFAVETHDGQVIRAAPIARWAIGKPLATVLAYYRKRGANIEQCGPEPAPDAGCTVVNKRSGAPYDVYVGRPSEWGNPYHIGPDGSREDVIAKYRAYILAPAQSALLARVPELTGKRLACWCAPLPCHGDILAELAALAEHRTPADRQLSLPVYIRQHLHIEG